MKFCSHLENDFKLMRIAFDLENCKVELIKLILFIWWEREQEFRGIL
jgi:hypothetical protein